MPPANSSGTKPASSPRQRQPEKARDRSGGVAERRIWIVLFAVPLGIGLAAAIYNAWVCDDAFITFRYVDQLANGHGLVYNMPVNGV